MNRIRAFLKNTRGFAVVEFALMLPVLMTVFYGAIEVTRYILIVQKCEKLANAVADVTAQSTTVTVASLNQILTATNNIMEPFNFSTSGQVMITSIYRPPGANSTPTVNWRHTGGGTLAGVSSQLGAVGAAPVLPVTFAFEERENLIAAEVYFRFSPLISTQFFGTSTIYRQAFYKPRFGLLTTTPA